MVTTIDEKREYPPLEPSELPPLEKFRYVIGYGSLMANPQMPVETAFPAMVPNVTRSACVMDEKYRGTAEVPALAMGAEIKEGALMGCIVFKIAEADLETVRAKLQAREMPKGVQAYKFETMPAKLLDGRTVEAAIYVADDTSPRYAGHWTADEQAQRIAFAKGPMGDNIMYFARAKRMLEDLNFPEAELFAITEKAITLRELKEPGFRRRLERMLDMTPEAPPPAPSGPGLVI